MAAWRYPGDGTAALGCLVGACAASHEAARDVPDAGQLHHKLLRDLYKHAWAVVNEGCTASSGHLDIRPVSYNSN